MQALFDINVELIYDLAAGINLDVVLTKGQFIYGLKSLLENVNSCFALD
jgi:hypothetical protein